MVRDRKLMIQALKSCNHQMSWEEVLKLICDAADTLAQADDIISKKIAPPVVKHPEWISVKDRLPDCWEKYLCLTIMPYKGGFVRGIELVEFDIDKHWVSDGIVTHWLETPEFPPAPTL